MKTGYLTCVTVLEYEEFVKIINIAAKMTAFEDDFKQQEHEQHFTNKENLKDIYDYETIYLVTIDDFSVITFVEPDDGYRDRTITLVIPAINYKPLPKPVWVKYRFDRDTADIYGSALVIHNSKDETIFNCCTEDLNDWYPSGVINYYPENMGWGLYELRTYYSKIHSKSKRKIS